MKDKIWVIIFGTLAVLSSVAIIVSTCLIIDYCNRPVKNYVPYNPTHMNVIMFDSSVHQDDLNSNDLFKIYYRKSDTIYMGYPPKH